MAGADGLTIETRLFELNGQALGRCVPLATLDACADLVPQLFLPGVPGVGLAVLRTPLANCVDGSADAVEHLRPAVGLLHAVARCEEQLNREFANGASRVFASEDLLRPDLHGRRTLQDDLFVGLPDDPSNLGVTVYSPALREGKLPRPQAGPAAGMREPHRSALRGDFERDRGGGRAPHRHRDRRHPRWTTT